MLKAKIKCVFIIQFAFAFAASAENWSINQKTELPPESDQNRIIKWCDNQNKQNIRFASANIEIKGYHPCGAIIDSDTCDAENNKILGKPKSGIFKSCSQSKKQEQNSNKGLSHAELKELKSVMKKAAEKQNSDPEIQLQILADQLLASFFGNNDNAKKDLSKLINTQDPQKLMQSLVSKLEKSLPLLDPDTRKLVEPLLKNLKQGKY